MGFLWDPSKNSRLQESRGVSFEQLIHADLIAIIDHPKRSHQEYLLVALNDYIWAVPFVRTGTDLFLKTAFQSRVYTKKWKRGELG